MNFEMTNKSSAQLKMNKEFELNATVFQNQYVQVKIFLTVANNDTTTSRRKFRTRRNGIGLRPSMTLTNQFLGL